MADEINVGRLVAEIILDAKTEGADEAISKLDEVESAASNKQEVTIDVNSSALDSAETSINNLRKAGQSPVSVKVNVENDEDLIYIKDLLSNIGITGQEAEKILNNVFSDTSGLNKYKSQLEDIAQKLEDQREMVEYIQSLSKNSINPSNTDYIDREIDKLKEL